MYHHKLSRDTFDMLQSTFGTKERAEIFAGNLEEFLDHIDEKAGKTTVDRLETIRLQIKEDLSETLVTREMFEERFKSNDVKLCSIDEKFKNIDERFNNVDVKFKVIDEKFKLVDERFKSLEDTLEIRFNAIDDRFKLVDEKFDSLRNEMNERFSTVDVRFKSLNFKFNILIALTLAALTFANPTFVKLLDKLF